MTGTTFPVAINLQVNINALYDTGATKSCMNYDTFFSLGLDLDDKLAPHVKTASGTDMGAIGFVTLTFAINKHVFTQQFIVCRSQMRPLISGQDFCVHHCTGCEWTPLGTKRFTANQFQRLMSPRLISSLESRKVSIYPLGIMVLLIFSVEIYRKQ